MITDYPRVKKALVEMKHDNRVKGDIIYPIESFKVPVELQEYVKNPKKTVYISGESGAGKTEMVKTVFATAFGKENCLRINNLEGMKDLNNKRYKALILDDVDFNGVKPEEMIGLCDVPNTHTQRVLYGTVEVPAGMARAVVSNRRLEDIGKF